MGTEIKSELSLILSKNFSATSENHDSLLVKLQQERYTIMGQFNDEEHDPVIRFVEILSAKTGRFPFPSLTTTTL